MAKFTYTPQDRMDERKRVAQNLRALKAKGSKRKAKRVQRHKDEITWLKLKCELAACRTALGELSRDHKEEAKEAMNRADGVLERMRTFKKYKFTNTGKEYGYGAFRA